MVVVCSVIGPRAGRAAASLVERRLGAAAGAEASEQSQRGRAHTFTDLYFVP
jgi:hypothetical protein